MKFLNFTKGVKGEVLATDYLKNQKYKILKKNFKSYVGEIDIIAFKDKTICFIEVKYRETLAFGYPREAVTKEKQQKIKRTAEYYLMKNNIEDVNIRFDVVEIVGDKITFIESAFQ